MSSIRRDSSVTHIVPLFSDRSLRNRSSVLLRHNSIDDRSPTTKLMMSLRNVVLTMLLICAVASTHTKRVHQENMRPWGVSGNVDPKLSKSNSNSEFTSVAVSTDLKQDLESINSLGLEFAASKNATKAQIQSHGQSRQGPPCIVLMGGPSSGKGTQSERIVQHYDVVHLSTGDMLREVVQRDAYSPTGEIAKLYMERGELVPDDIITKIVLDRISQPDCLEHGWILDGFPRTRGQAEAMKRNGLKPDLFVLLNVPDANLLERVAGRRTDPVTGKIYHLQFFPPPTREIEKRLVQRSDDTVPHMAKRLEQFHANVNSVRHFFQDVCVEVNGMGSPDEVAENVFKAIDGRQLKTA